MHKNVNKYDYTNQLLLMSLSTFLNDTPNLITINEVNKLMKLGVDSKRAYSLLLKNFLDIDNEIIINEYFPYMINELDDTVYMNNPYYKNISFKNQKCLSWELKISKYDAYEAFVCDDFKYMDDGRVIPQIGYFKKPFKYLAVYEKKHLWMSVTPNEIETMKYPIEKAYGDVVTLGLGLGYYAYMVSLKENVNTVTIIEKDPSVIKLFKECILPQFKYQNKINIINMDAFEFLNGDLSNYNFLFADIWHDVSDGKDLYLKIKYFENKHPHIDFEYWIENTIKYYL